MFRRVFFLGLGFFCWVIVGILSIVFFIIFNWFRRWRDMIEWVWCRMWRFWLCCIICCVFLSLFIILRWLLEIRLDCIWVWRIVRRLLIVGLRFMLFWWIVFFRSLRFVVYCGVLRLRLFVYLGSLVFICVWCIFGCIIKWMIWWWM